MNSHSVAIRRTLITLLLITLVVVPSFIANQSTTAASKVLRVVIAQDFPHLDPQKTGVTSQASAESALFRGLLRYDQNGNPAPSIAIEVPSVANGGISTNGMTYTFKLRDWKWSDGKTLTAEDFVYTYQRIVDPQTASPYGTIFNDIIVNAKEVNSGKMPVTALGVKAVNPQTFEVSLTRPVPYFNALASMWIGAAVRKDNVQRPGLPKPEAWTDPANGPVITSGPFTIVKWDHNNEIVFERNANFSGTTAKLDQIIFKVITVPQSRYIAYQNNEVDITSFPAEMYDGIQKDPVVSKEIVQYGTACTNGLGMNNARPPFNNKQVREAFTYGLNRDLREKVIDGGIHLKFLSWLPQGVPGYDPALGKAFDYDVEKARKALADAGYPDGKGLPEVIFSYPDVPDGTRVAAWYKEQFKKVLNIDIKLDPMDPATYVARLWDVKNPLPSLYEYGWCADYLDPSNWLPQVFGTGGSANVFGYSNAEFDALNKAADAEPDPQKALELYKKAHAMLVADFPIVFFNTPRVTKLVKPKVKGLTPHAMDGGMVGGFFWEAIDIAE